MVKQRIRIVICLALCLLLVTGCEKAPEPTTEPRQETTLPAETPPATTESPADISLNTLREEMSGTAALFAVAYFGYNDTMSPTELIGDRAQGLLETYPFLKEISGEQTVGSSGELFCIVPRDPDGTVTLYQGIWDGEREEHRYETALYSGGGAPIFLLCNGNGWEPDTLLHISGPSGEVFWHPGINETLCAAPLRNDNGEELFLDFSPYREQLVRDYGDMLQQDWNQPEDLTLMGRVWAWRGTATDGRALHCRVRFYEDTCDVYWNDGYDEMDHRYIGAPWELTCEGDYSVLSIDFQELAGVLRYNVLYSPWMDWLYVAMDVTGEAFTPGWEPLCRFLDPNLPAPDAEDMAGTWELAWTEVEGDLCEAEPGAGCIQITTDYEGLYWVTYRDGNLPGLNFTNEELAVFPGEMYMDCGNSGWTATVNYSGAGMEHEITLLESGMLLMRTYWEFEGGPMVSYGWYRRTE